jgi:hypothetical protein
MADTYRYQLTVTGVPELRVDTVRIVLADLWRGCRKRRGTVHLHEGPPLPGWETPTRVADLAYRGTAVLRVPDIPGAGLPPVAPAMVRRVALAVAGVTGVPCQVSGEFENLRTLEVETAAAEPGEIGEIAAEVAALEADERFARVTHYP